MAQQLVGPDGRFAIRYVSRARVSEFMISVIDLMPSGMDVKIEAVFPGSDRKPVRLIASRMASVVHQQTGEVIDDPVSWFRLAWLDRSAMEDGAILLEGRDRGASDQ